MLMYQHNTPPQKKHFASIIKTGHHQINYLYYSNLISLFIQSLIPLHLREFPCSCKEWSMVWRSVLISAPDRKQKRIFMASIPISIFLLFFNIEIKKNFFENNIQDNFPAFIGYFSLQRNFGFRHLSLLH